MKKRGILGTVVMLSLCLTACGSGGSGSTAAESSATAAQPATAETTQPAATEAAQDAHLLEEPIEFNATFSSPIDSVLGKNMQKAYDQITERTGGDLKFVIYPSSQLGNTIETLESMRAGAPVICCLGFDNMGDYIKEMQVASAPYVFNNTDEVSILANTEWMKSTELLMNEQGFAPLAYGSLGYRHFISTKEIKNAADISGKIIRMGNSGLAQNFITVMGGNPTTSDWNDNYSSLQQGIFDACEASLELLYSSSLYEVCDYLVLSGHFVTPTVLTMNMDYWNQLPDEYKAIVREELQLALDTSNDEMKQTEGEYVQMFKDAGTTIFETDKSTFSQYVPALLEEMELDPSIYEDIRRAIDSEE